jgi:hypothetical protein
MQSCALAAGMIELFRIKSACDEKQALFAWRGQEPDHQMGYC